MKFEFRKLSAFGLLLSALIAQGNDQVSGSGCDGKNCKKIKNSCFNVYCSFKKDKDDKNNEEYSCQAAAQFDKAIFEDGKEVEDNSDVSNNPTFEIECKDNKIFNGTAHRYTDSQGTRIQAQVGPFPALVLPRGALHDGHGYAVTVLELGDVSLRGSCYLYTGPALMNE